jgi:hypothetical protein
MPVDLGGTAWLVVDVVFVLLLALGMAYATLLYFRPDPEADRQSEAGTKALYDQIELAQRHAVAAVRHLGEADLIGTRWLRIVILLLVAFGAALVLYLGTGPREVSVRELLSLEHSN